MLINQFRIFNRVIVLLCFCATPTVAEEYPLGPQDQLSIKVFDIRPLTGEAYQWKAFDGVFAVSAGGRVALPLIGELDVAGKTTADLAQTIAIRLQARVGLAARPDASVQVSKFRPFYVLGGVERPGEYEFRADLTVLKAVSLAGGPSRGPADGWIGYLRDAVSARGEFRVLLSARMALLARQARLEAEIAAADTVDFSHPLLASADDPDVPRILQQERMLFEARRHAIQSQTAALEQTKAILQQEVAALAQKDVALSQLIETTQKQLKNISGLVTKGLSVAPRQSELEISNAQLESNRLDVAIATSRARQDAAKADRDILELKNTRRSEALQEATEVRNKLAETERKIETAQRLIVHFEVVAPGALAAEFAAQGSPDYQITRVAHGVLQKIAADENDSVLPGDVVRVVPRTILSADRAPSATLGGIVSQLATPQPQ